ncbi:MAG: mucoidy inhibitor MuiA family protein [Candidatus Thorarchaeota archaeon]|nr:mucoidy inhibitor MuiA family protein [Candidatus Thorarchaeota archaeon]
MTTRIDAPVNSVTVFVDGARVTRKGAAPLAPGEQDIIVRGITKFAQDDSFRVKGTGRASIRGINVETHKEVFEPEGDTETLRSKLRKLEDERDEINDELSIQETRVERIQTVLTNFSGEFGKRYAFGDSEISALAALDEETTTMREEAYEKIRELQRELEKVEAKISEVKSSLQRIEGERRIEATKEVKIRLDVREECTVNLEVTYQIQEARWIPQYDIDVMDNRTTLKRLALIWNHSIEDWIDVDLVVSTASAKPVRKIEPEPFYIQTRRADTVTSRGETEDVIAKIERAYETAGDMKAAPVRVTETTSGGMVFQVPGRVTVPADRDQHPITLLEEEFESEEIYYWNAYAMDTFVIQNRISNGDSLILPGKVKVYADGDFLSETAISTVAPREEFYLGTREAYDIKGEKKMFEKETEKAGLTRGKKRRIYKYHLKTESFAKEPVTVRLVDRIPHSDSERINVELKNLTRDYKSMELGVIVWEFEIPPEEEMKIEYSYSVEWEKDIEITPPLP